MAKSHGQNVVYGPDLPSAASSDNVDVDSPDETSLQYRRRIKLYPPYSWLISSPQHPSYLATESMHVIAILAAKSMHA
jgi:hypothetical protein